MELPTLRGEAAKPYRSSTPEIGMRPVAARVPERVSGLIYRVQQRGETREIALTFDLCEGSGELAGYDGRVVDFLRENGVPATFFMGGKWAKNHEKRALQLLADPLFEVGNHSYSHPHLPGASEATLRREILGTEEELASLRRKVSQMPCAEGAGEAIIPSSLHLFRFPYGEYSRPALDFLNANGFLAIQWDMAPGDPAKGVTGEQLARDVERRARPGSIVVLHANGKGAHTADALALFVPELRRRGFEFVTVGRLLAGGIPVRE